MALEKADGEQVSRSREGAASGGIRLLQYPCSTGSCKSRCSSGCKPDQLMNVSINLEF